jgi:hypothetical protein
MPSSISVGRKLIFQAHEAKYKHHALAIHHMDPRNKSGFGHTIDEIADTLRQRRRNGEKFVYIETGMQTPVALFKDNGLGKEPTMIAYASYAATDKEYTDAVRGAYDKFKDPVSYKLTNELKSIVNFAENTGLDPSRWKKGVSFDDLPPNQYEKRLVESFADEIVLAHRDKVVDPGTLAKTLNSYSNKEGMEVYWNKLGDVCGQYMMLNSLFRQEKEGSTLSGKVKNWVREQKEAAMEDGEGLSESFEKNVLDNLGGTSQSMLKKLVEVFEAIGRALGKSLDMITDKLAKACGAIGNSLGLHGQAIEYAVSDGFTEMRDGASEMVQKLKAELKNPAMAGLAAAATASVIPMVAKLNQSGLNPSDMLYARAGEAQLVSLGIAAVALAASPIALKVQEWAKKPKNIEQDNLQVS